jgi:hypothetical protein
MAQTSVSTPERLRATHGFSVRRCSSAAGMRRPVSDLHRRVGRSGVIRAHRRTPERHSRRAVEARYWSHAARHHRHSPRRACFPEFRSRILRPRDAPDVHPDLWERGRNEVESARNRQRGWPVRLRHHDRWIAPSAPFRSLLRERAERNAGRAWLRVKYARHSADVRRRRRCPSCPQREHSSLEWKRSHRPNHSAEVRSFARYRLLFRARPREYPSRFDFGARRSRESDRELETLSQKKNTRNPADRSLIY